MKQGNGALLTSLVEGKSAPEELKMVTLTIFLVETLLHD